MHPKRKPSSPSHGASRTSSSKSQKRPRRTSRAEGHARACAGKPAKSKAPAKAKRKEMRRGGDRHRPQTPRQSSLHKSRVGKQTYVKRKALEIARWLQQQHLSQQLPTTSTETPQQPVPEEMPLTISYSGSSPSSQIPSNSKLTNAIRIVPRSPTKPLPQFGLWGWGHE
jgi:hypothetical protein